MTHATAHTQAAGPATPTAGAAPIVDLRAVSKRFGHANDGILERVLQRARLARPSPVTHALDEVDLLVRPSEVVGLVGESGCGKSTLGRLAVGLDAPTSGQVLVDGRDRQTLQGPARSSAALDIQMIFQDAYASLNPRLRVDRIVGEGARLNGLLGESDYDDYVCAQLERAGLDPALRHRYPHQFSGGQRQRIGIARALAVRPRMLVCDEAVAALDVSIQAQVLNLFMDLRDELGLAYLFISHDLSVIRHLSDRVVVMYLGRVVESAPVEALFSGAAHPYTQALLAQIPKLSTRHTRFAPLQGEIPSPLAPVSYTHLTLPTIYSV